MYVYIYIYLIDMYIESILYTNIHILREYKPRFFGIHLLAPSRYLLHLPRNVTHLLVSIEPADSTNH